MDILCIISTRASPAVVAVFTPLIIFGFGVCALLCSYLLSPVLYRVSYVEEEA